MRKEPTLPIAERMENVFFAEISIDPGENIALPQSCLRACAKVQVSTALGLLKKIMPDLSRSGFSESGERRRHRF